MFSLRILPKAAILLRHSKLSVRTSLHLKAAIYPQRHLTSSNTTNYSSTPKSPPRDWKSKLDQGIECFQQQKFQESATFYQQIIDSYTGPDNKDPIKQDDILIVFQAYYQLGRVLEKYNAILESSKQYSDALNIAKQADITNAAEVGFLNNAMGRILLKSSKLDEGKKFLERAKDILEKLSPKTDEVEFQLIENQYMTAVIYGDEGELEKSLELLEGILERVEDKQREYRGELDLSLVNLSVGNMYLSKKDIDKAVRFWDRALDIIVPKRGEVSSHALNFYYNITKGLLQGKYYKEALKYANKNLSISQEIFDGNHPRVAEALLMFGLINFHQQNFDQALESYNKAVEVLSVYPEQYHDQVSFAYLTIAEIYLIKSKEEEAREAFDKGLKIAVAALGDQHFKVGDFYLFWGELLRSRTSNIKGARLYFNKAYDIYIKAQMEPEIKELKLMNINYDLGVMLFGEGNLEVAMKHLEDCLCSVLKSESQPSFLEDVYNNLGSIYFQLGNFEKSIEYFLNAIQIAQKGEDSHKAIDIYFRNLGLAYEHYGHTDNAIEAYLRALKVAVKNGGKDSDVTRSHLKITLNLLENAGKHKEAKKIQKKYGETEEKQAE